MARKELTKLQQAFLDDLFIHPQTAQYKVYMRHYKANEGAARANSARLLSTQQARDYLSKKQEAAAERTRIREDEVVRRFWDLADFDLADIYTNSWDVKPLEKIPERTRRAIIGMVPTADGGMRLTFASRLAALTNVAKMLGFGIGNKQEQNSGAAMMRDLFSFVQKNSDTGKPGSLRFDPSIAAQSAFDADD